MRRIRGRKKKLIVAFHFHFANQSAWKCDECRKHGLEIQRRCGFLSPPLTASPRPVWARRDALTFACPKSAVSADSAAWLDEFFAWKMGGKTGLLELPARTADAFLILEREWRSELQHEQ